jgi:hypothetical protein
MNNNKEHWIYSFDDDKNISFAIASVLNGYFENEYDFINNIEAIQSVHHLNKTQAKKVINKANEYINKKKGNNNDL